MARDPRVDEGIIVGNISDPQGFSTDCEDRRSVPIGNGCPSGDIPTESSLSAVAVVASENVNTKHAVVCSEPVKGGNVPLPDGGRVPDPPVPDPGAAAPRSATAALPFPPVQLAPPAAPPALLRVQPP